MKKRTVASYVTFHSICQVIGQYGLPFIPFVYRTGDLLIDIIINGGISIVVSIVIHYVVSKKGQKAIKKFYKELVH